MLLLLFISLVLAQDYDCPTYSTSDCTSIKKSQKCTDYFEFLSDYSTGKPTKLPVRCVDDPGSKRYCKATPASPSTPTSGLCRPRCVNNQKQNFYTGDACSNLATQSLCALSLTNCGYDDIKCDWCAYDTVTGTCYTAFICNDRAF